MCGSEDAATFLVSVCAPPHPIENSWIRSYGCFPGGGVLQCQGGYQAHPKFHVIRVVFQDLACTHVQRLGVQKRAKLEKRVSFWSYRQILERT